MTASALSRVSRLFEQFEKGLVVVLTVFLMGFALMQILLRDVFGTGIIWSDILLRHTVVWIGLVGAMRATAEDRHIRIDLVPRLLPPEKSFPFRLISDAVPLVICLVLLYGSIIFVIDERQTSSEAFPGVPYWWLQLIFPTCFGVMALRYGSRLIEKILLRQEGRTP